MLKPSRIKKLEDRMTMLEIDVRVIQRGGAKQVLQDHIEAHQGAFSRDAPVGWSDCFHSIWGSVALSMEESRKVQRNSTGELELLKALQVLKSIDPRADIDAFAHGWLATRPAQ